MQHSYALLHLAWIGLVPLLAGVAIACAAEQADTGFSWQDPHATVLETGDLEWKPRPFEYRRGGQVRYIDFAEGSDENPGTKDSPWKHHPWDAAATAKAAQGDDADTFVFKGGVVYRGSLAGKPGGSTETPVRLTRDPDWGDGPAVLCGAERIEGGWEKLPADQAPPGLDATDVWVRELVPGPRPWTLWRVDGQEVQRLRLARTPNWREVDPEDNKSQWYIWDQQKGTVSLEGQEVNFGQDTEHITYPAEALKDAFVYSEWGPVMGTPAAREIIHYDRDRSTIYFRGFWGKSPNGMFGPMRYYLENSPYFLDEGGEWWLAEGQRPRLFLRVAEGEDPNQMQFEAGRASTMIALDSPAGHVEVSGLTFRFTNVPDPSIVFELDDETCSVACVRLVGSAGSVRVSNCTFEYVGKPVYVKAKGGEDLIGDVTITDNDIRQTDLGCFQVEDGSYYMIKDPPKGTLRNADILRNRMFRIGFRPQLGTHGHAVILKFPETSEVAGNMLHRGYGAGLFIFGGKPNVYRADVPLSRILVHHNRVVDPLINTNDWGGIETWQGGPYYVFNNVSGNPGGYWNFAKRRFGFAYYLDGSFKNYHFNNIAWGIGSEVGPHGNTSAFQEIFSYQNTFFHNSVYKFVVGSRRQSPTGSRDVFAANVWEDLGQWAFWHGEPVEADAQANQAHVGKVSKAFRYETNAYTRNVFAASPDDFGIFEADGTVHGTMESMAEALARRGALASDVGEAMASSPYRDANGHDFRLKAGSKAIGRGVKVFVPWGLYGMVGEWNFRLNRKDPTELIDDHWFMRSYYAKRNWYFEMPTHTLKAHNVSAADYEAGDLEDWTPSALAFNGRDQYAVITHEELTSDFTYNEGSETVSGSKRIGLDMGTNNFCIEAYLRLEQGETDGVIVAKSDGQTGYALRINEHGSPMLKLMTGGRWDVQVIAGKVNDGQWHHLLAEIDRAAGVSRLYVDGKLSGKLPLKEIGSASLANDGDFCVGGTAEGDHLAMTIDFLRISRGTLADARTTIQELRAWQFDGPQYRDFTGHAPVGDRDAGAIEMRK